MSDNKLQGLKITIENQNTEIEEEEKMEGIELGFDDEVAEEQVEGENEKKNQSLVDHNDQDEGPEFHVTLNKIPPTLQNTILVN
jgi:hypothetical protein